MISEKTSRSKIRKSGFYNVLHLRFGALCPASSALRSAGRFDSRSVLTTSRVSQPFLSYVSSHAAAVLPPHELTARSGLRAVNRTWPDEAHARSPTLVKDVILMLALRQLHQRLFAQSTGFPCKQKYPAGYISRCLWR